MHALLLGVIVIADTIYTHWTLVVVFGHNLVRLSEERLELPLPLALPLTLSLPAVVVEASPESWWRGSDFLTFLRVYEEVLGCLVSWRFGGETLTYCLLVGLVVSVMACGSCLWRSLAARSCW